MNPNSGHGHVRPRPDGVRARCGGPGLCPVCQQEANAIEQGVSSQAPEGALDRVLAAFARLQGKAEADTILAEARSELDGLRSREDIAPLLRQLGELQRKNDSLEHRVRDLAPMSIGNTGTSLELRLRYAPDFLGSLPYPDRHLAFELESARRALLKAIRFKPSGPLLAGTMQPLASQAETDVLAERQKQREKWSYAHDDERGDGEFVRVVRELLGASFDRDHIPYDEWELLRKHPQHRDRLVIAAALLIAELDRLDRAALRTPPSSPITP